MDIKDIMGIKGDAKAPAAKKSKGPAEKKPEGVSREDAERLATEAGH